MAASSQVVWRACLQDLELLAAGTLGAEAAAATAERVTARLHSYEEQPSLPTATWKLIVQDMKVGGC